MINEKLARELIRAALLSKSQQQFNSVMVYLVFYFRAKTVEAMARGELGKVPKDVKNYWLEDCDLCLVKLPG